MDVSTKVMFKGESAASLLAELGCKFDSKESFSRMLEGMFLIAAKDALCLVDDINNPNVPNALAAGHAYGRAIAFLSMIKMQGSEPKNAVQEQSPKAEVSRASEPGKDEAGSAPGVGEKDGKRKTTGTRGALRPSRSHA